MHLDVDEIPGGMDRPKVPLRGVPSAVDPEELRELDRREFGDTQQKSSFTALSLSMASEPSAVLVRQRNGGTPAEFGARLLAEAGRELGPSWPVPGEVVHPPG